jgi:hypothetical protein
MLYIGNAANQARLVGNKYMCLGKMQVKTNILFVPHLVQGPPDTAPLFPAVLPNFQLCPIPDHASGFCPGTVDT